MDCLKPMTFPWHKVCCHMPSLGGRGVVPLLSPFPPLQHRDGFPVLLILGFWQKRKKGGGIEVVRGGWRESCFVFYNACWQWSGITVSKETSSGQQRMKHIHGEEWKPCSFERLLFLLGHKDTGSGSQEWAYKAAPDGWNLVERATKDGRKKDPYCRAQVIVWLTVQ